MYIVSHLRPWNILNGSMLWLGKHKMLTCRSRHLKALLDKILCTHSHNSQWTWEQKGLSTFQHTSMIKCRDGKFLSAKEFSVCATGHDLYVVRCTADKIILVVALSVLKTVLSLVLNNFVHMFCLVFLWLMVLPLTLPQVFLSSYFLGFKTQINWLVTWFPKNIILFPLKDKVLHVLTFAFWNCAIILMLL